MNRTLLIFLAAGLVFAPAYSSTSLMAQQPPAKSSGLNVCEGTFALCTEATCKPMMKNGNIASFSCDCKVQKGYSVGFNGPKNRNSCQSIPHDGPTLKQKVPSRYSPITSFVAYTNNRPWAQCLDAPCVVDHVDENDSSKGTAKCLCPKTTASPYGYIPADGQYSRSGCEDKYISSATVANIVVVTQFLTTPAGKNLPPSPITILVPTTGVDATGKWEEINNVNGYKSVFEFKVENSALTGTITIGGKTFPLEDRKVSDSDTLSFNWTTRFPPEGRQVFRAATGKLSGDKMELKIKGKIVDSGQEFEESMTLKRSN
ncbi:MAG TPA: hypothetical protein VG759_23485 [Candidatus Angelobacter sp.]|nr:hypothetical protein [Candidatus Angelobacter sp.]